MNHKQILKIISDVFEHESMLLDDKRIHYDGDGDASVKSFIKSDVIREVNRIKEYRAKRDIIDGLA